MLEAIKADVERYTREPARMSLATLKLLANEFGLQAVLVYRLGQALKQRSGNPLWWPLILPGWFFYALGAWLVGAGYGIRLALSARIGPGLYIGHFGGIDVRNCRIGARCTVGEQCRIGGFAGAPGPDISDRVWIGGHAHVLGPVSIGEGVTIGSGALVEQDVPARALIIGRPARITSRDYDNSAIL